MIERCTKTNERGVQKQIERVKNKESRGVQKQMSRETCTKTNESREVYKNK